jgi:hypothetical protein
MFVKTDCVDMPINALVTVNFQPDDGNPLVCFQAKAIVVHQRKSGFGLEFEDLEAPCAKALHDLLAAPVLEAGQTEATEAKHGSKPAEVYPRWAGG